MAILADKVAHRAPALWLEVGPPRGVNPEPLLRRLAALVGHVDAINLTDNALGKVKMSSIAFGTIVKLRLGLPVVINLSCRDRNRFALKSDLIGAAALGIDAIVALTGDKIPPDDPSGARAVHDLDAFALLRIVGALNRGDTGEGKALLKKVPDIFAGAVANPNRKNIAHEFEMLKRKADAGAKFVITQPVFDLRLLEEFLNRIEGHRIPVIAGIWPLTSLRNAEFMKNDLRVSMPEEIMLRMAQASTPDAARKEGILIAQEMLEAVRPLVQGVQVSAPFGRYTAAAEVIASVLPEAPSTV